MNFRNISAWCIRNPVPPIVLFVGLMLAGIVSFMGMQVNNNPDIDFPAAEVTIAQPGAAPTEMETQITQKVEAAIRGVEGVDEINSSVREGNSSTFVHPDTMMALTPTWRSITFGTSTWFSNCCWATKKTSTPSASPGETDSALPLPHTAGVLKADPESLCASPGKAATKKAANDNDANAPREMTRATDHTIGKPLCPCIERTA